VLEDEMLYKLLYTWLLPPAVFTLMLLGLDIYPVLLCKKGWLVFLIEYEMMFRSV